MTAAIIERATIAFTIITLLLAGLIYLVFRTPSESKWCNRFAAMAVVVGLCDLLIGALTFNSPGPTATEQACYTIDYTIPKELTTPTGQIALTMEAVRAGDAKLTAAVGRFTTEWNSGVDAYPGLVAMVDRCEALGYR